MDVLLLIAGCFVLGLLLGSFGNVVIHRVPSGASIVAPPSACPACEQLIRPRDNIPVLSWLLLRGKCRDCGEPIPVRYPLVEVATGIIFAGLGARFGPVLALPGFLLLGWFLVVVTVIDAQTRRIPNRLTYPLTPVLLVLFAGPALLSGEPSVALRVLLAGSAAFTGLLALALISPAGMGMGDVKLAASLGFALGYISWGHVLLGIVGSFMVGGVIAILLIVSGIRGRKDQLPFGPYLAISTLLTIVWGQPLIDGYLALAGLG